LPGRPYRVLLPKFYRDAEKEKDEATIVWEEHIAENCHEEDQAAA